MPPPQDDHADIEEFETIECLRLIRIRNRGAANLTVRSQLRVAGVYELTVTRRGASPDNLPYSLVNLGIQAVARSVWLLGADRTLILSRPELDETETLSPATDYPFHLEKIIEQNGTRNDEKVWLVNFDPAERECKMIVSVVDPRGPPIQFRTGHDIAPPPPEPGGDN